MSMAAGEYVSVSSQSDAERADLARETDELADQPEFERQELADIYVGRGLDPELALSVADQLMAKDALGAHARDELGISDLSTPRPFQAAFASAATFSVGAAAPLIAIPVSPQAYIVPAVVAISLACLVLLGYLGARTGNAAVGRSVLRISFWGILAMAFTAAVGWLFGVAVA
jgi:vacuolar iron transporter family protein